jgi:DNA-binding ferritin-like protein (Dps family)
MRADLEALSALLTQITQGAEQAHQATQRLTTTAGGASTSLSSLSSLLSSVSTQSAQTAETVQTHLSDIQQKTDQAKDQITTRLDDLQDAVANHTNLWNKAVSEMIDAVKIGAIPIEELLDLYGEARIGGQRLIEYLDGLDFNFYQNHVRDLIKGLNDGTVEITRVQKYLGETQLIFAKQLSDVIELFRKGAVTLKRVEEIVRQVQKAFPDSDLSDLAEALYNALRRG